MAAIIFVLLLYTTMVGAISSMENTPKGLAMKPMIAFTCGHCGCAMKVEEKHAGRKSKCPKCLNTLLIPPSAERTSRAAASEPQQLEWLRDLMPEPVDPVPEPHLDIPANEQPAEPIPFASPTGSQPSVSDHSCGIASLYLASLAFLLLFFAPISLSLGNQVGLAGFLAAILVSFGGFVFSLYGWGLARKANGVAMTQGSGMGYAIAGRVTNACCCFLHALSLVGWILLACFAVNAQTQQQKQLQELQQLFQKL